MKKGAMFGLDARIALAIFGALSVISGAALYSSIQESKKIRMAASLEEVKKALTQYILDTGSYMIPETSTSTNMRIGDLFENYTNVTGWSGPYIGVDSTLVVNLELTIAADKKIDRLWNASRHSDISWGSTDYTLTNLKPCTKTNCMIYLRKSLPKTSTSYSNLIHIYTLLDEYYDNNDGAGLGKVRARTAGTTFYIYLELMPEYTKLNS